MPVLVDANERAERAEDADGLVAHDPARAQEPHQHHDVEEALERLQLDGLLDLPLLREGDGLVLA